MPTPAEVLLEASSLNSGTPWELLNSIEEGSGEGFVLVDTVEVELVAEEYDVEIVDNSFDVELVDNTIDIEFVESTIDVEIE